MSWNAFRSAAVLARLGAALAVSAAAQGTVSARFQDGVWPTSRYAGTHDTTITIQDEATDGDPTTPYGGGNELRADGFPARLTSLMLFPLDGGQVPPQSVITGAYLSFSVTDDTYSGFTAYELLRPWTEREATYRQASSGQLWSSPGASRMGVDRSGIPFATFEQLGAGARVDVPLTDAGIDRVRKWHGGVAPNYGIILQDFDSWDGLRLESRETVNPPKLYVSYNAPAGAGTASISASADTFLGFRPTILDGWGLGLSGRATGLTASLLRFDLRAIPPGVQIQSAKVRLSMNRNGSTQPFNVSKVLRPWTESATWTSYDGQSSWGAPGAQGTIDRDPPLGQMPPCASNATCEFSLPEMVLVVQGWVDDPTSNLGLIIQEYTNGDDAQLFDSEAGNPALRPALEVTFVPAPGATVGLFPARAAVSTGEQLAMMAFGGSSPYTFSLSGSSDGGINSATGLYTAGPTPGQDQLTVRDQNGAQASAIIDVLVRPFTPDAGQPDAGVVADAGTLPRVSISLESSSEDSVVAQEDFAVRAEIDNNGSSQVSGLVLLLAPAGLSVSAPTLEGGGALQASGAGYALPPISGDDKVQVHIPARVTALPGDPLSLTVNVASGGTVVDSATLDFTLAGPPPFQTSCGCGAGSGSLGLLALASAIFTLRARRRRSSGAEPGRAARRVDR